MKYTKITIKTDNRHRVPYFIGSQVRGALGYILKKTVCINPSFKCEGCFASSSCLYYEFYEAKNATLKYRLDFDLGKDHYDFDLYLFEDSCSKAPYIISALYTLFSKSGIGKDRNIYDSLEMYVNNIDILKEDNISLPKEYIKTFEIKSIYKDLVLHFVTPLRLKKNNRFIRDDSLELNDIINSIYQRQMRLLDRDYRRFPYEIKGEIVAKDLSYKELTRKSNRQQIVMNMGGIVGSITIKDIDEKSYNILRLGELLAVGKQSVFGLGKIMIKELDE
ncbi:MAG: CRISPR system precrRNA processing endoribonuclease RAMP protein Cas6 [Arcobacteraceae bacterium]|nr:CRISPR system precrRNA processing endoribonuclease RAMP protein Cas6 [Arcobacteraceae bacterium]